MTNLLSLKVRIKRLLKTIRSNKLIFSLISSLFIILILIASFVFYNIYLSILIGSYIFFFIIPIYIIVVLNYRNIFELFSFFFGTYLLLFTLSWTKYEFYINNQRQMLSVLSSLTVSDNRKNFSPIMSRMTQPNTIEKPTIFSFNNIIYSIIGNTIMTTDRYAILTVRDILSGYNDWSSSGFNDLNMRGMIIGNISFNNSYLNRSNFEGARLFNIDFSNSELCGANFKNAYISDCNFDGADLQHTSFENATIVKTSFKYADFRNSYLFKINYAAVDFEDADFTNACFVKECKDDVFNVTGYIRMRRVQKSEDKLYPLISAKSFYNAIMPKYMEDFLKKLKPELFKK